MDVPPELACSLCLDAFHDPVLTPCRHTFCRLCIARVLSGGHASCPLCRGSIAGMDPDLATADDATASLVAACLPARERRLAEALQRLVIVVGNLYEEVPDRSKNRNKWTMYTTLSGAAGERSATLIEKVVYQLHPTFNPSVVTAYAPNFAVCRRGWGTFTVRCIVHWNTRLCVPPTRVDHELKFEDAGGRTSASVDVSSDGLMFLQSELSRPLLGGSGAAARPARPRPRGAAGSSAEAAAVPPAPRQLEHTLEVVVGNRCKIERGARGSTYTWTMYACLPEFPAHPSPNSRRGIIKKVIYDHPSFNPGTEVRRVPPFELTSVGLGSGILPVMCCIHWHSALGIPPTEVFHTLKFEPEGGRTAMTVGVSAQCLQPFR